MAGLVRQASAQWHQAAQLRPLAGRSAGEAREDLWCGVRYHDETECRMSEQIEISFVLNGESKTVQADPARSVMDVFRQEMGITSIKPGCSPQGICGCCAALVNGKPRLNT